MTWRQLKRRAVKFKRGWRQTASFLVIAFVATILAVGSMTYRQTSIDPVAFAPLLDLVAKAESNGNYNAYFGRPANTEVEFTSMTIGEVLAWQQNFIDQGSPSSAVGRYQILNTTLASLVNQLAIDTSEKFDRAMQDRLALALVERRGAVAFVNQQISREEFAANLAKEWAALPKVIGDQPDESYYASDGLNKSRVKVEEILTVIDQAGA